MTDLPRDAIRVDLKGEGLLLGSLALAVLAARWMV
jgi:hypothetical protein